MEKHGKKKKPRLEARLYAGHVCDVGYATAHVQGGPPDEELRRKYTRELNTCPRGQGFHYNLMQSYRDIAVFSLTRDETRGA